MFNTISGMSIQVNGGSVEENSQLCTVVAAALRSQGFTDVRLDASREVNTNSQFDTEVIAAMRHLSPDLFELPVVVQGESEDEMRANMAAAGFAGQPFAYHVPRGMSF